MARAQGRSPAWSSRCPRHPSQGFLSSWVRAFGSFDAAHGWAVNLFVVIALAAVGVAFLVGEAEIVRWAVLAGVVLCLADWVLVEDFGFLGGVGTDPNSMLPMALVFVTGYIALVRVPVGHRRAGKPRLQVERVLVGAARSARARVPQRPHRGRRGRAHRCRPDGCGDGQLQCRPTDRRGDRRDSGRHELARTSLPPGGPARPTGVTGDLRGRTVALTFLDPVCTSDCPIIAQEFHRADTMLGSDARHVSFVAVVANPIYRSTVYTQAFDRQEGLSGVPNWLYLTGSTAELTRVWNAYGIQVGVSPAGSMIAHGEETFIIDGRGRTRVIMDAQQGEGAASESSFTVLLNNQIERVLHS